MSGLPLVERVRARLALEPGPPSRAAVAALVRDEAGLVGDAEVLDAVRDAVAELAGAGPLEPLLREPGVTDVLVNGPSSVYVDRGAGLERAAVRFPDEEAVRRLAVRLAASAGRRLDDAAPWVDAGLPDGTRLHAVLPPVSDGSTCLSLRVLRRARLGLDDLAAHGTLPGGSAGLLRAVLRARLAFLVTGGTGSGKTTLLAALLGELPAAERLVLCEDAPELAPAHPHVVRLLTRPANVEGAGTVSLRDLVRQALRMRPDRLVVGEVRGGEVTDLTQYGSTYTGRDAFRACDEAPKSQPNPGSPPGSGWVDRQSVVIVSLRRSFSRRRWMGRWCGSHRGADPRPGHRSRPDRCLHRGRGRSAR